MIELAAEFLAQFQVTVHHQVEHAQHQVSRTGRQAAAGRGTQSFVLQGIGQVTLDECLGGKAAGRVDRLLARYPLLMGELSYRPGLTCEGGKLCPEWRELLLTYPTRFMIGSDTWVNQRWLYYDELMRGYRAWLGDLPADVARNIGWDNGASLFGVK